MTDTSPPPALSQLFAGSEKRTRIFTSYASPGLYIPDEGVKKAGVKAGVGIDYPVADKINVWIGSDYHYFAASKKVTLNQNVKTSFQHFHSGIIFRLR